MSLSISTSLVCFSGDDDLIVFLINLKRSFFRAFASSGLCFKKVTQSFRSASAALANLSFKKR
jgi:hypothetical protein